MKDAEENALERLARYFRVGSVNSCWEWQGSRNEKGYGNFMYEGRSQKAHRVVYSLKIGPIPVGACICHSCDNPPCVNPAHLFAADMKANMDDMTRKRRNPTHKLSYASAEEIRRLCAEGRAMRSVARDFGVAESTVRLLMRGKTWMRSGSK